MLSFWLHAHTFPFRLRVVLVPIVMCFRWGFKTFALWKKFSDFSSYLSNWFVRPSVVAVYRRRVRKRKPEISSFSRLFVFPFKNSATKPHLLLHTIVKSKAKMAANPTENGPTTFICAACSAPIARLSDMQGHSIQTVILPLLLLLPLWFKQIQFHTLHRLIDSRWSINLARNRSPIVSTKSGSSLLCSGKTSGRQAWLIARSPLREKERTLYIGWRYSFSCGSHSLRIEDRQMTTRGGRVVARTYCHRCDSLVGLHRVSSLACTHQPPILFDLSCFPVSSAGKGSSPTTLLHALLISLLCFTIAAVHGCRRPEGELRAHANVS